MKKCDLLVIGSGPAGQRSAIQAAKLGKKVLVVEQRGIIGGVSLNTGTIPSKTLREAALYLTGWDQRGLYGKGYRLKADLTASDLTHRLNITVAQEMEVMRHQLIRNGVEIMHGVASLAGKHRALIKTHEGAEEEIECEKTIIAVGTRPVHPKHIPFDGDTIIDSDGIISIQQIPRSLLVVGAGVIGIEYASIFSTLDIKVTVVDSRENLLSFMDKEITDELIHSLRERGVLLRLGEEIISVQESAHGHTALFQSGKRLDADMIMVAAGRTGNTPDLNLESVGIATDTRDLIQVNSHFQTSDPDIYAVGDIVGFPSLAATAMEQGRLAVCHAFNHDADSYPNLLPFGIYSVPEISMVGSTEEELTKNGVLYETGVARLRETARGQIMGLEEGMLKILFGINDRKVLGIHILGEQATELIHIGQAAMALGGALDFFINNVFNYPTLAEAYKVAALDAWNRF